MLTESIFDYPTVEWLRQDQTEDSSLKQKWNYAIINRNKFLFFNDKEMLFFSCYDVIIKLSELSKLSKDYIAEMQSKLGLIST